MLIFNCLLTIGVIVLFIPVSILLLQVIAALFSKNNDAIISLQQAPRMAVLMPAHNESLVIEKSIQSILPQLSAGDSLLVVADNCSDDTASIAKKLGATVIERQNRQQRGKGYALDFGLQYLQANPPTVVVVVDADCLVEANTLALLSKSCAHYQRPIQALYIMEAPPNPNLKARIAAFAWMVKNKVRPLGFKVLGLPCQLMGTGMAFLWSDLSKINLASGHIVEDMKLGIDLARINKAPVFSPQALVTSVFPVAQDAANTQRARWEHGHLSVILAEAPRLFFQAIKLKNIQMFALACDLIIPPLAVLALLYAMVFGMGLLFVGSFVQKLSIAVLVCLFLAVLLAWVFFGREIISFKQLCYAPIYALTKIPLYVKFFFNRQVEWVRSKRD